MKIKFIDKMIEKKLLILFSCVFVLLGSVFIYRHFNVDNSFKTNSLEGTILAFSNSTITVRDKNNDVYIFNADDIADVDILLGSDIVLEYTGLLDKSRQQQDNKITSYRITPRNDNSDIIPSDWLDDGIFKDYYQLAYKKLQTLSTDEKIGQIFLVRYPDDSKAPSLAKKYNFGGYVFFAKDFNDKTKTEVKNMINNVQSASKIPLLTAVDEEGGTVVRVSSNPNLVSTPFLSPRDLYNQGGLDLIKSDTINKSKILYDLGLNLNLAPVLDVTTDPSAYMYNRSLGENTDITSKYAETVIEASKGTGVSYTLKHFPGYGNNEDTHTGTTIDDRTYDDILANDIPPFTSGIKAGAEAILVSHNTVTNIDANNPASLSKNIHDLLRNDLGFTGVIITDDLDMGAVANINDAVIKAILAGNDLIITTDYEASINAVKDAINNNTISSDSVDKMAFKVLAWKYYKGLIVENQK